MTNTTEWTLYLDESGCFEGELIAGGRAEQVGLVLGGLLCAGPPNNHASAWLDVRRACAEAGVIWPPHANRTKDPAALLGAFDRVLEPLGARWVFTVTPPPSGTQDLLAAYLRLMANTVDVAARLVARLGGKVLHFVVARRVTPLSPTAAAEATRLGLVMPQTDKKDAVYAKSWAHGEIRQTLEALAGEDAGQLPAWPKLGELQVVMATAQDVPDGVFIADFANNHVYGCLGRDRDPWAFGSDGRVTLVGLSASPRLRDLDRTLRATPPDLHRAAVVLERLRVDASRGARGGTGLAATAEAGDGLWRDALDKFAALPPAPMEQLLRTLAAHAHAELDRKTGDYQGTWRALDAAWSGGSALAQAGRLAVHDRELVARLWRLVLEAANHRGDNVAGLAAFRQFEAVTEAGTSLNLLSERLTVLNLFVVQAQNRLPAPEAETGELLAALVDVSENLRGVAEAAGELVARFRTEPLSPRVPPEGKAEEPLWAAAGKEPAWRAPDRERGRCLGTVARSLAFAGRLDEALDAALEARTWCDDGFDLRFNASVVSRILLERARLTGEVHAALGPALTLAGARALWDPDRAAINLQDSPGERFNLDLLLRALLWAPSAAPPVEGWRQALRAGKPRGLHAVLAGGPRSHPTELVARHAGEVLMCSGPGAAADARSWFDLASQVTRDAPEGSAIARFGQFTKRLAAGQGADPAAPAGSVGNPTFEYR